MAITIFSGFQYLEEKEIPENKLNDSQMNLLDEIISLEVAIYNMRNTHMPRQCDGFNVDTLRSLRESTINRFQESTKLIYAAINDYND